jgi:hypothetical protein
MEDEKDEIPVEKLVRVYIKMRTARDAINAEFNKKIEDIEGQMEQVKRALSDYCKENNVESVRTKEGLFYRTIKQRYWTNDWEAMGRFVVEHNIPEVFEKRLHQGSMQEFLDQNPDLLPPGLNIDREYQITVRRK